MKELSRQELLNEFLSSHGWGDAEQIDLAGDASFRRYKRLKRKTVMSVNLESDISPFFTDDIETTILMDAPPPHENITAFTKVARFLTNNGLNAPYIIAEDKTDGFLILEDFGDHSYTKVLSQKSDSEEMMYMAAIDVLAELHKIPVPSFLPEYDEKLLLDECNLCTEWYQDSNMLINDKEWKKLLPLIDNTHKVTVLRDYHADNLMWLPNKKGTERIGLLDFQDAVIGSPAYDLVSLLEDARRDLRPETAEKMIAYYLSLFPYINKDDFLTSYAILGAQRNCKILGIFSRLAARDKKDSYLSFIPRVLEYLKNDMKHPVLKQLGLLRDKEM